MWRSIQFKIMAAVGVILLVSIVLLIIIIGKTYEQQLTQQAVLHTSRMCDMAEMGIRHQMMQHQRARILEILDKFTQDDELEKIRLYDKEGRVVLSTDITEINAKTNLQDEMCTRCHDGDTPIVLPAPMQRSRIFTDEDRQRRIGVIAPIFNEPPCYECHNNEQKVLGVLDAVFLLKGVDSSIHRVWWATIISAVMALLIAWAGIAFAVEKFVRKPVKSLVQGTEQVARGDLDTLINVTSQDEMGRLCTAFNEMSLNLKKAAQENSRWNLQLENKVKTATTELETANRNLREAYQHKSIFIRTVVHQLRAPVAGMQSFLRLITSNIIGQLNDQQQEMLQRAERKCAMLMATVNDLLDIAAISESVTITPIEPIDLTDTAKRLVEQFAPLAQKKGIEIRLESRAERAPVRATARDMEFALSNLLANAVNYTQEGEVCVTVRDETDKIVLIVVDTGIGIAPDDIEHCFEEFYRGDNAHEYLYEGTGLGLSIVKKVVEKYAGIIKLESKLEVGTTVTISFAKEKS